MLALFRSPIEPLESGPILINQLTECRCQFRDGRALAQGLGIAVDDREVAPQIVDRLRWQLRAVLHDQSAFADDAAFGGHNKPVGINPQAGGAVRDGSEGPYPPAAA